MEQKNKNINLSEMEGQIIVDILSIIEPVYGEAEISRYKYVKSALRKFKRIGYEQGIHDDIHGEICVGDGNKKTKTKVVEIYK